MKEREIQNALFVHLNQKGRRIVVPNYTPRGWWECDLFSVTMAGFMVEHEIKLTRSDFQADARKERERWTPGYHDRIVERKHDLLAAGDVAGPSRFFYVVPEDLVTVQEAPAWAGLIFLRPRGAWTHFHLAKRAPSIHRCKVAPSVFDHSRGVLYWRYWALRRGVKEQGATSAGSAAEVCPAERGES